MDQSSYNKPIPAILESPSKEYEFFYSFGVVIFELLTGRKPVDHIIWFVSPLLLFRKVCEDLSKRREMDFESSSWMKDGVCFYPHLFGGITITCSLLSFSTSHFGMIGVPTMPHLSVFHKKKSAKKRVRVYMDGCFDLMH